MRENELNEMVRRFDEFKSHLPEQVKFPKAGPNGQDVILPKEFVNGVLVYSADVDVPFIGLDDTKQQLNSKHLEYLFYLSNLIAYIYHIIIKRK